MAIFHPLFCKLAIFILHTWLAIERLVMRIFLKSAIKKMIVDFYLLETENAGLMEVHDDQFYIHAANKSTLGLCESYMKGWISISEVDKVMENVLKSGKLKTDFGFKYKSFLDYLEFDLFEVRDNQTFYDEASEVIESSIGPSMNYSCALWLHPEDTLESAQRNKMEVIARKLKLAPGMRVLDIGCGYGAMAKYLAEEHGVHVVGTTSSAKQVKYARNFCKDLSVDIINCSDCSDFIKRGEKFDRIIVIEVLTHIKKQHYAGFFSSVSNCLKDDGILILQDYGSNQLGFPTVNNLVNSYQVDARTPYIGDIIAASAKSEFVIEDFCNIGAHYDKTNVAFNNNFLNARENFVKLKGEQFCKMWSFMLLMYAAVARTRTLQEWLIVFTKNGMPGGYSY